MLRLLLTPRWLGVAAFVIFSLVVCGWLGAWQFDAAKQEPRPIDPATERAVPVLEVLENIPATESFPVGLRARGVGRYDATSFEVTGTDAAGAEARWTVSPFVLDGGAGTLAVVRGLAEPAPSAPITDDVVLTGRLQPPVAASAGEPGDDLTRELLVEQGLDPRGYVVLIEQQPPDARPATLVESTLPEPSAPPRRWQNTMYAFQWWGFGLFTLFAAVRFFREDLREQRETVAA